MNPEDSIPLMILAMHGVALGLGLVILSWMLALNRRARRLEVASPVAQPVCFPIIISQRPPVWLAVRAATPEAVSSALGLSGCSPCSWSEGIAGNHEFFISPQLHGWVIVTGLGLPNPSTTWTRFSFSGRVEPQAGPCGVFSRRPDRASSRLGARR